MKSNVFINLVNSSHSFENPVLSHQQEREILAQLFEELLVFDKITFGVNRTNFPLYLLLKNINLKTLESLVERNCLKFMIWSPLLLTGVGRDKPDGTRDISTIYGQPPIVSGTLVSGDTDIEHSIEQALNHFNIHRVRKRSIIRKLRDHYFVPEGFKSSGDAARIVIEAYKANELKDLDLPYNKEPDQLDLKERGLLLDLGYRVLENSILAKYDLKSFNKEEPYKIFKQSLANIGNAYQVAENTSKLLKLENLPDLKQMFLDYRMNFDSVLAIRSYSTAKYFRKWINTVSESVNAEEIAKEFNDEVEGKNRFFNQPGGKILKLFGMYGLTSILGNYIAGTPGAAIADIGLGLLDTFWLDNILKGKNPRMFINLLQNEVELKDGSKNL